MEIPIYYDYATVLQNAVTPGSLKPHDNMTTQYYIRYLLKRAFSVFEFKNIPENWDINYFRYVLFCRGFLVVINSPKVGVIPQLCTLGGFGVYRTPTFAMVANQALPPDENGRYWLSDTYNPVENRDIKGTAVLVKLQPDYRGILDICTITAERLAFMHEALHQAPLFMSFSRQGYWSQLSCPLPGIFPTQGLNLCPLSLLHYRQILCPLSHLGSLTT